MMKRLCLISVLVGWLGVWVLPGVAANLDHTMEQYIAYIGEIRDTLINVRDEPSARAASPKIQVTIAKMWDVAEQFKGISPTQQSHLERAYATRMQAVAEQLRQEIVRVMSDPHLAQHVHRALSNVPGMRR